MSRDLQELRRRTKVLVEASKELCDGSFRALKESKCLLEKIESLSSGANGDARECTPKVKAKNTAP